MKNALTKLASLAVACAASAALAQNCPTQTIWPTADWTSSPVDATAKAAQIKALEDYAFTLTGADGDRLGFRTDGLLIIKHGAIIYERYARGFDQTKRHISWSVAKSFSSSLVGIAVKEGSLDLAASICTYLPEFAGTEQCAITVKDVITFGTGLGWQEGYEHASYQTSSVISMFFGVGHRDQLKHILTHKIVSAPGKRWNYSTGDAELAAALAKRALTKQHGPDAFWNVLFDRIGMNRAVLEEDLKGTPLGGSHLFATPRDFAKFGYLFLNDGCWNGERILPEGWVASSTKPSDPFVGFADLATEKEPSGYMWWLNRAVATNPIPWTDVPADAYSAIGHWGQYIVVIPSEDTIVVRTGDDREGSIDVNDLTKFSLAVAR